MALQLHLPGILLQQQWWHNTTTVIRGVSKQHEAMVEFASRQLLDMVTPSNFPPTNPVILERTVGAFQMSRSNDLIWSRMVHDYLLGKQQAMTDLTDATRMPYRMHSEYLRKLFLDNDLVEGRFAAAGKPVSLTDIRAPIFAVGTERDHVAPWHSTYKINLEVDTEVTYLLTTGGHNAGIVSEPGHAGRSFRLRTKAPEDRYVDPERFYEDAACNDRSWWPQWAGWLQTRSGAPVATPAMATPASGYPQLAEAPGVYVLED